MLSRLHQLFRRNPSIWSAAVRHKQNAIFTMAACSESGKSQMYLRGSLPSSIRAIYSPLLPELICINHSSLLTISLELMTLTTASSLKTSLLNWPIEMPSYTEMLPEKPRYSCAEASIGAITSRCAATIPSSYPMSSSMLPIRNRTTWRSSPKQQMKRDGEVIRGFIKAWILGRHMDWSRDCEKHQRAGVS